jgi:Secretion system C-terminal sorting domain/Bacterial Ig-like domain (group 2)/NHL repeat
MKRSFLLFALVALTAVRSSAQNIYTFAGISGTNGYSGDDSLATLAHLSGPGGIGVAASGNVYFGDTRNDVVRMVNTSGVITTIAGNGVGGYSGDGGPATSARLRNPNGIAFDAAGNIYIADSRNNVVRKVDASGIITTIAGTGMGGYAGDGGPATDAQLRQPVGLAIDASGNLYIADSRNFVVRKVNTSGVITTYAGNNTPGYTGDGSAATAAQISGPLGLAITTAGNLFIADSRNHVIRMVNTSGIISTFAGTGAPGHAGDGGPATTALLEIPTDVKVDVSGNVFVTDSSNTVRMINTSNIITNFAGTGAPGYSGDGGAATAAKMTGTFGLAIDAAHNVYISTPGNNVIRRVGAAIKGIFITSNVGDTACIGHATSFIATPVADATPHYQWRQNGINVGTDVNTYTPGTLATGDMIDCILLSAPGGTWYAISNNMRIDSMPRTGTLNGPSAFCIGSNAMIRDFGGPPPGVGTWVSTNTAVATVTPPGRVDALGLGTTTIYLILTNGCGSDSASFNISVGPNNIGMINGPAAVCVGTTVTYSDTTSPGRWATRPGPFGRIDSLTGVFTAGFIPGPDVIIYGISPGCYRVDTIMIDSLPAIGPIAGPTVVDSAYTITLTDPVAGGSWSSSNTTIATVGSGTGVVTGVNTGTVTITYTVTSAAGCTRDTTYVVTVASGTGIHNITNTGAFSIYPNPASGLLYISAPGLQSASVTISDVTGRSVLTSSLNTTSTKLDISSIRSGIYLISIKSVQGNYSGKLVIE